MTNAVSNTWNDQDQPAWNGDKRVHQRVPERDVQIRRDYLLDEVVQPDKRLVAEAVPVGQTQVHRRQQRERRKHKQTNDLRPHKNSAQR
jgi:hypothetical protein